MADLRAEPRGTSMNGPSWQRLLLGNAPWSFLLEVGARTLIVYGALALVARLLGKRMSGRLGNWELAVMIALGAIVAAPFQDPNQGVVTGVVLLVVILGLQRGLSALAARFKTVEHVAHGHVTRVVRDGVLQVEELRRARVSVPQLFAVLRSRGLRHLGQAKRVYLEAQGDFSVLKQEPAKPGLSLAPYWDEQPGEVLGTPGRASACRACARVVPELELEQRPDCPSCGESDWTKAVEGQ